MSTKAKLVTFYGYKGGAGRSLLAANVASVLALGGAKVLLVDWDLEAPGLGDFLDLEGNFIPEKWRLSPGLFELLAGCADAPPGEDLARVIGLVLDAKAEAPAINSIEFPPGFTPKGNGRLDLLGPGRQHGPDFDFALSLMSADWSRFFDAYGPKFHQAFRGEVNRLGYDFVVIDTRTGMNLPALVAMRLLSDHAFLVSPKTFQALDGVYRMWQLLDRDDEWRDLDKPEKHLIIARFGQANAEADSLARQTDPTQDDDITDVYVRERFKPTRPYYLPFLKEVGDREQLFVRRSSRMGSHIFNIRQAESELPAAVMEYRDSFWDICELLREGIRSEMWPDIVSALFSRQTSQVSDEVAQGFRGVSVTVQKREPSLDEALSDGPRTGWVDDLIVALRAAADDRARPMGAGGRGIVPLSEAEFPSLALAKSWLQNVNLIKRATVRAFLAHQPGEILRYIPEEIALLLYLGLEDIAPASAVAPPIDYPSTPPEQEPAEPPRSFVNPMLVKALKLYNEARKAREDDDPGLALDRFQEAADVVETGLAINAFDNEAADASYARAIYVWEVALTLDGLADWDRAIERLLHLVQTGDLSRAGQVGIKQVALRDILKTLLDVVCAKMAATGWRPAQDSKVLPWISELSALASGEWPNERQRIEVRRSFRDFRILNLPRDISDIDAEIAEQMAERLNFEEAAAENITGKDREQEELLAKVRIAGTCALLARLSPGEGWLGRMNGTLESARLLVEASLSKSRNPVLAGGIRALAGVFLTIGRHETALSLYQDALQLLVRRDDLGSMCERAEILIECGLCERSLGRPDLARETWKNVTDSLAAKRKFAPMSWDQVRQGLAALGLPVDSRRARDLLRAQWWPSISAYETGDYQTARAELIASHKFYSEIAQERQATFAERLDAQVQIESVDGWLAGVANTLGDGTAVELYCARWKEHLQRVYYQDVDAARRLARCELIAAESAYRDNRIEAALEAVRRGKAHNRLGADRFGLGFARVQDELTLLELEIQIFRGADCATDEIAAILSRQRREGFAMLESARTNGWYYRELVSLGLLCARAAAMLLRLGEKDPAAVQRAVVAAREVLDSWLAWIPGVARSDALQWLGDLAALPRILSEAVLAKAHRSHNYRLPFDAPAGEPGKLSDADAKRYARILDYCRSA